MWSIAVSEKQCFIFASQMGFCLWCSQVNTFLKNSEKWDILWRLILYKKPSSGVLGLKGIVCNQSFQQIPFKHWKLDWALNMQRNVCCLQLVNVLPLIATISSSFLSGLSLLSPYLFSPCLSFRGRVWSGVSRALFPKWAGFVVSRVWALAGPGCWAET